MLNTEDVRKLLLAKYDNNYIKDAGYDSPNGRKYVEIRNVIFQADKNEIFQPIDNIKRMDESWYVENYEPKINAQIPELIKKLINNPASRQATLILQSYNAYMSNDFPCTVYIHLFLDKMKENTYMSEYSVHMRSSDAMDFATDIVWNNKIYDKIITKISEETGWTIYKSYIIWNADSFQLSLKNFIKDYEDNTTFN